jgi:hypothetical protein
LRRTLANVALNRVEKPLPKVVFRVYSGFSARFKTSGVVGTEDKQGSKPEEGLMDVGPSLVAHGDL